MRSNLITDEKVKMQRDTETSLSKPYWSTHKTDYLFKFLISVLLQKFVVWVS